MSVQNAYEKIKVKIDELNAVKTILSDNFLKDASIPDLEEKLTKLDDLAQQAFDIYDNAEDSDVPDYAIDWQSKRQQVLLLRDNIKRPVSSRIAELKRDNASQQITTKIKASNDSLQKLIDEEKQITARILHSSSIDNLKAKKAYLDTLHNDFIEKYNKINQSELSEAQRSQLSTQKTNAKRILDDLLNLLEEEITSKKKIHEEKTDAERKATTAQQLTQQTQQQLSVMQQTVHQKATELTSVQQQFQQKTSELTTANQQIQQKTNELSAAQREIESLKQQLKEKSKHHLNSRSENSAPTEEKNSEPAFSISPGSSSMTHYIDQLKEIGETLKTMRKNKESEEPILGSVLTTEPSSSSILKKQDNSDNSDDDYELAPEGPASNGNETRIKLKIDTIQLPDFNGDLTEWITFKELFVYLVHKNTSFSDTLKFHQLRTHLKGAPLDMIKGYQLTGANYKAAWTDLKRRYDRKDELIQEYIRKFLEIPPIMNKANLTKLRAVVDATNQMLRALPALGVSITDWDPFILLIINLKLDDETRSEWKQQVGRKIDVKVKELIEFLETRAIELQPTQGDKLSQLLKGDFTKRPPRRIFQVTEQRPEKGPDDKRGQKRKCTICQENHPFWHCDKLRSECAKVRTDIVKSLKLCFKCLLKHEIGVCNKSDCPYCGGPHNSMLCYKKENDQRAKFDRNLIKQPKFKPNWGDEPNHEPEPTTSKNTK